eukprot:scaffold73410_cov21-Phaeocystis_antarctica.AAC.1
MLTHTGAPRRGGGESPVVGRSRARRCIDARRHAAIRGWRTGGARRTPIDHRRGRASDSGRSGTTAMAAARMRQRRLD